MGDGKTTIKHMYIEAKKDKELLQTEIMRWVNDPDNRRLPLQICFRQDDWERLAEPGASTRYQWEDFPEQFFHDLAIIPNGFERLKLVKQRLALMQKIPELKEQVRACKAVIRLIKECPELKDLLRKVLYIGNCFNAGNTVPGYLPQADAFDAVTLIKEQLLIGNPKGRDGLTLLEYLKRKELTK